MARVLLSSRARADLVEIWSRLTERSGPHVADAKLAMFERRFASLRDHPLIGRERPEIHPQARSLSAERWLVLYRLDPGGVRVLRIVNAARDLERISLPNT